MKVMAMDGQTTEYSSVAPERKQRLSGSGPN